MEVAWISGAEVWVVVVVVDIVALVAGANLGRMKWVVGLVVAVDFNVDCIILASYVKMQDANGKVSSSWRKRSGTGMYIYHQPIHECRDQLE